MKKLISATLGLALVGLTFSFKGDSSGLSLGDKAPMANYEMKDISGKMMSLDKLKGDNGLLVVFSCNTCPFVIAWEDTYPELGKMAKEKNIGMVLVNSNEAKREKDDSFDKMKEHYKEANYNSSYVVDQGHKLADAFGAQTTPHVYLFDKDMKLAYKGAINDKYENREKKATKPYLMNAMENMAAGKEIEPASTKQVGCSIKRKKH